jgi:hypothetical protein
MLHILVLVLFTNSLLYLSSKIVVKNRLVSLLRSLKARSRFVVKFFLASSRFAVNRRGTGPSKLSLSNKFVVRGHSARSTVATASLYYDNIKIYL